MLSNEWYRKDGGNMNGLIGMVRQAEQVNSELPVNLKQLDGARKSELDSILKKLEKKTSKSKSIREDFLMTLFGYSADGYDVQAYWDKYKKVLSEKHHHKINTVSDIYWETVMKEMITKYNINAHDYVDSSVT